MKCLSLGDIETKLHRLLFSYRMTPSTTTGKSPAELFQRQPRSQFDRMLPISSKESTVPKEAKQVEERKVREFEEEDTVWVKNFGEGKKWVAGTILKRKGKVNYQVVCNDKVLHRHIDQLIARVPDLGIAPEEGTTQGNTKDPEYEDSRDEVTKPRRQRKTPSWTKDFEM
jgi:hypothetical protein